MFADQENVPPISKELFQIMRLYVPRGETVLELGSGPGSTEELKPVYNLYSVEHNDWCRYNSEDHYLRGPLVEYQLGGMIVKWYPLDVIKKTREIDYKAVLFDRPDSEERMIPVVVYHELFNPNVHWFFDDWTISKIREGIENLQRLTNRELLVFESGAKKFAVLLAKDK